MWDNIKCIQSKETSVKKYVFEQKDAVVESVLYKYPDYKTRTVICCSTQSGCPVGCRFCGTGDYFVRSLTAEEIVSQVRHCLADTNTNPNEMDRLQIMVMSMGEPLLNKQGLSKAFETLYSFYPKAALLISTIGPRIDYSWVYKMSKEIPTVGLQFSVHKTTDAERNKLIPFKEKLNLAAISEIGEIWNEETGRKPFFNYCAGDDNTSMEDAQRLRALLNPKVWNATISVICERNEGLPAKNDHQMELAQSFRDKLRDLGFDTRVFDPAGQDDVGGGCGQLWYVQDWMKRHPELAKPSIGNGLPEVHTPTISLELVS